MKSFTSVFAMAAVASMSFAIPAAPALAQADQAAQIDKDFGCVGFVPTASGDVGLVMVSTETVSVVTNADTATLTCHFDIPEGSEPATATRSSGFACGTYLGGTNDSRMIAAPGGNAILICRVKKQPA